MADSTNTKDAKKKTGFFQGVQNEFRKIVWPDKDTLIKQTILVIVISVILGIMISVIDGAALQLLKLIIV